MPRLPWLERAWIFDEPVDLYPSILERLRGTPARLEEALVGLTHGQLVHRVGDAWSIQTNVGHLMRLEALPAARLDDFLRGAEELCAWTGNEADDEAGYDERDVSELLAGFRKARAELLARLDRLDPEEFGRAARHPRLERSIRLVDMCRFQAEHDDHHLARIQELKRERSPGG